MNVCKEKKEAIEKGLRLYNTGKPCTHGHYADRYTKGGACVKCRKVGKPGKEVDINGKPKRTQKEYIQQLKADAKEYRDEALERKYETYPTELPCSNGHFSRRYTKSGKCIQCVENDNEKIKQEEAALKMESIEHLLVEI